MKRTVAFIIHHISNVKSGLSHACKAILDNVSEAKAPIQLRDSVHSSTNSQNAGLGFERCCRAGPSSRCTCCSHACSVKPLKRAWHFEVEISELISAPGSCVRKPETKKKNIQQEKIHQSPNVLLQETTCHTSLLSMRLKGAPDAGLPVVGLLDGLCRAVGSTSTKSSTLQTVALTAARTHLRSKQLIQILEDVPDSNDVFVFSKHI